MAPSTPLSTKRSNENIILETPTMKKRLTVREVTAADINDKIGTLMQDENFSLRRACTSARLFAAYLVEVDSHLSAFTPGRSTRKTAKMNRTQPIMPLLQSLVNAEYISLNEEPIDWSRKVQFSGYDCSSTKPAITSVADSHLHHEECIEALAQVMTCIQNIVEEKNERTLYCLESIIQFLQVKVIKGDGQLAVECAKSIDPTYPSERIVKSAHLYVSEFLAIIQRICGKQEGSQLELQMKLAVFVGQAVKYWLRLYFDEAPPRSSPADTKYEERIQRFSIVNQLVNLKLPPKVRSSCVEDKVISAIFSNALEYIHEFLSTTGNGTLLDLTSSESIVIGAFFDRPGSRRTIKPESRTDTIQRKALTHGECIDILRDVSDAFIFIAAYKSCMFLIELLAIDRVRAEVERQGGWEPVETLATISWKHKLGELCDPHFVMLANYQMFIQKLEILSRALSELYFECEKNLKSIEKVFGVRPNVLKRLGESGHDAREIVRYIKNGRETTDVIPRVEATTK